MESFHARLRDELLNGEILYSLRKAEITIESGRRHTNTVRPHASPGYKPPAPEALIPALAAWPAAPAQSLRRPGCPWPHDQCCTNIRPGHSNGGQSRAAVSRGPAGSKTRGKRQSSERMP